MPTLNLHFPEFPDLERNGEPCRGLSDTTKVGDCLFVDGVGTFVISSIDGMDATLMMTNAWDEEPGEREQ